MSKAYLADLALSYAPMLDASGRILATRLSVAPLKPSANIDLSQVLSALEEAWPEQGGQLCLNLMHPGLLAQLFATEIHTPLSLEIPEFIALDPSFEENLLKMAASGHTLLLQGLPTQPLPASLLPVFKRSLIPADTDRRQPGDAPSGVQRQIPFIQIGVRSRAAMHLAWQRGACAIVGWPTDDIVRQEQGKQAGQPDGAVVMQLIQQLNTEEPVEKLDATLKRDPALAYKLMRYINSPGFGLSVEISSFRHAIMILGYQRLKRWLALLLATACTNPELKPVMFASVRRGILMEELVRSSGDEEMASEMFICGVFSQLDLLFGQPFSELLKTLPVPERVSQALAENTGPFAPYFRLVKALENEDPSGVRSVADDLLASMGEVNRAVIKALGVAATLDAGE